MEGPGDKLHIGNEVRGELEKPGKAKEEAAQTDKLKILEEINQKPDRSLEDKACCVEEAASHCLTAAGWPAADASQLPGTESSTYVEPHTLLAMGAPQLPQAPAPVLHYQPTPKAAIAEMDCLICFNRYSTSRLPKLLACQHAFCAICLKLILRNEDHTWIITCPLCRRATVVFGGLVCSLRDKEDVLDRLRSPDPDAERPRPADLLGTRQVNRWFVSENQGPGSNQAAAQRLVLLLLLLAMLLALILPFMVTGLLKWALCCVVVLGLIMSGVLCCSPSWNLSDFSLPHWWKKESHIASVA